MGALCVLQDTLQRAHSQPHSPSIWCLLASVALQYATSTHQAAAHRSAFKLCKRTLHLLDSTPSPQQLDDQDQTNGHPPHQQQHQQQQQQQQQQQRVKLHFMMSECLLHTRQSGSSDQAMSSAKAAVRTATGLPNSELTAAALQQLSRWVSYLLRSCWFQMCDAFYAMSGFP